MEANKSQKIPKKYGCNLCDYFTSNKKDYEKHLMTSKHKKGSIKEEKEDTKSLIYDCVCGKTCKTHGGIWKYKQKCNLKFRPEYVGATYLDTELIMELINKHQYAIGVVARRTQTHPETIRVWERRYELIVPGRSETGRRLYSENDIAKLTLVKRLTELGHSVSSLAKLSNDELRDRLNASLSSEPSRLFSSCTVLGS